MSVSDIENTTIAALREAVNALSIGGHAPARRGDDGSILDASKPTVASELAYVLDALVNLLGTVDLDPAPTTQAGHNLHALAQYLTSGAILARSVGRDTPADPPTA